MSPDPLPSAQRAFELSVAESMLALGDADRPLPTKLAQLLAALVDGCRPHHTADPLLCIRQIAGLLEIECCGA